MCCWLLVVVAASVVVVVVVVVVVATLVDGGGGDGSGGGDVFDVCAPDQSTCRYLGPVPSGFAFEPKHKANAYAPETKFSASNVRTSY